MSVDPLELVQRIGSTRGQRGRNFASDIVLNTVTPQHSVDLERLVKRSIYLQTAQLSEQSTTVIVAGGDLVTGRNPTRNRSPNNYRLPTSDSSWSDLWDRAPYGRVLSGCQGWRNSTGGDRRRMRDRTRVDQDRRRGSVTGTFRRSGEGHGPRTDGGPLFRPRGPG